MANAPTRPPNRPRSERRSPPRGPHRVPPKKRRDYEKTRALIAEAVEVLREDKGHEELAEAVAHTLTPEFIASGRYRIVEKDSARKNMAIGTRKFIQRHLKEASEAAGSSLTEVASEALTAFADGHFTPTEQGSIVDFVAPRDKQSPGRPDDHFAANINVRVDADLRLKADQRCEELSEELGWKVKLSAVVLQYALRKFPMAKPTADAGE